MFIYLYILSVSHQVLHADCIVLHQECFASSATCKSLQIPMNSNTPYTELVAIYHDLTLAVNKIISKAGGRMDLGREMQGSR